MGEGMVVGVKLNTKVKVLTLYGEGVASVYYGHMSSHIVCSNLFNVFNYRIYKHPAIRCCKEISPCFVESGHHRLF
jgi:hypothetical protein